MYVSAPSVVGEADLIALHNSRFRQLPHLRRKSGGEPPVLLMVQGLYEAVRRSLEVGFGSVAGMARQDPGRRRGSTQPQGRQVDSHGDRQRFKGLRFSAKATIVAKPVQHPAGFNLRRQ